MHGYQVRVIAEKNELHRKIEDLHRFISSEAFSDIRVGERIRMKRQLAIMTEYFDVLTEREDAFL